MIKKINDTLNNRQQQASGQNGTVKLDAEQSNQKQTDNSKPYQSETLNTVWKNVLNRLQNMQKQFGTVDADPDKDAKFLTDAFGRTVQQAYALFGGDESKDYLGIAGDYFQSLFDKTAFYYQNSGKTAEQLLQDLNASGYQSQKQIKDQNESNVLNKALSLGAGLPESQQAMIDSLGRITDVWNNYMEGGPMSQADQAAMALVEKDPNMQWMTYTNWWEKDPFGKSAKDSAEQWAQAQAQRIQDEYALDYAGADEYLAQNMPGYSFAKEHAGDLQAYMDAAGNITALIDKAGTEGWQTLTSAEQEAVWQALEQVDVDGASLGRYPLDQMTPAEIQYYLGGLPEETKAALNQRGAEWASELADVNGLYSAYAPTDQQNILLGLYRRTPEGAEVWAKEAMGTDEEQAARDNQWMVERKAEAEAVKASPEYQTQSEPKENFKSGSDVFDLKYQVINDLNGVRDKLDMASDQNANAGNLLLYALMEDEEKAIFNTLANTGRYQEAEKYLDSIKYALHERGNANAETYMKNLAGTGWAGATVASLLSIPFSLSRGFGALDVYAQALANLGNDYYRPIDYSRGQTSGIVADTARETVQESVNWAVNILGRDVDLFDFLYGTLMSGIDSAAAGAIGSGSSWAGAAILGLGAAQDTMQDIYDRDGNDRQIILGGTLAGIFETLFEEVSIGKFYDEMKHLGTRSPVEALKNVLAQAGINFSEEFFTELANIGADEIIMGELSESNTKLEEYVRLGMTMEQAKKRVEGDIAQRLLEAGFGGALMGGAFGAISNVTSDISTGKADKATGAVIKPETRNILWGLAESAGGKAKDLARKYQASSATNKHVGELVRETFNQIAENESNFLASTMENGDYTLIEKADYTDEAKQAIFDLMDGQELSPEQAQALAGDEKAMSALGEVFGVKRESTPPVLRKDAVKEADMEAAAGMEVPVDPDIDADLDIDDGTGPEARKPDTPPVLRKDAVKGAGDDTIPPFGAEQAYQMGLSGRRQEDLESTLEGIGAKMTDEIQQRFDQGRADLAQKETDRINKVKELNAGEDGKRVGVLRSISADEADAAGVGVVSSAYMKQMRDAVTALRGFAEATGVNMVLFESPVKEGVHAGDNGWYDRDTRTVYIDIYSGKENEKALLRTAAHELTHFIQDWSPARYKQLRDFLLDYYYSSDKETVKRLIQEQMDKDKTLTEPDAMDELVADASELMLDGDADAARTLGEQHPKLFARIRGWIDNWAKALTRAWRNILPSNAASKLLKASAEHFQAAQKIWWEALEDASVNNRGEIRTAEIEAEKEAKLQELRAKLDAYKQAAEKRRLEAIARADAAQTAEEGRQAVQEAQAAEAAREAIAAKEKEEAAKIEKEAEKQQKAADKITKAGQKIEKTLGRMSEDAVHYVRSYAEEDGIALDGSQATGAGFVKEAMHYYNQGKAGLPFNANTEMGQGAAPFTEKDAAFARKMNELGQAEHNRKALEDMAEPEDVHVAPMDDTGLRETEYKPEETQDSVQEAEQNAQETEEETTEEPEAEAEEEQQAEEAEKEQQAEEEPEAKEETQAEEEQREEDPNFPKYLTKKYQESHNQSWAENEEPTPQETQAMETHAQTVQKIGDVLKGMTKAARNLVMKWAANEQINLKMEEGSEQAVAFAQFAKKWYDAGKEGMPKSASLTVPVLRNMDGSEVKTPEMVKIEESDWDYPPFLQDEFYNQGKADAAAAVKRQKQKEAKKNEKPADKGTGEPAREPGMGTERVLEEVPAEDVQANGGGRDTVRTPEVQERRDGAADAGPDEPGTVRERGEGVHQRNDVRPEAGKIEEETGTPEEIQAKETEEKTEETVEKTDTELEAKTPRGTNYQIGESLDLPNGEKARYKANMEAIRLLKQLEAEDRYATPEEQDILSKYVGWGGLASAFDENNSKWKREYAELAEALTGDEYNAARASTTNAHYTSIEVIRAMYEGLRHLGFQGGRMLEPSGGIGHFIGAMPADMQQSVRSWTMVELDSITGRIAQKLYPNADVRVEGFENAKIGNNVMDVAIGNVPFGNFPVVDSTYPKQLTSAIHNYFFAKAIDKVRPGGLLMFITSRYTMDSQDSSIRQYMMSKADLLGAVRLPYTAFKGNAGTDVVTDILIFKKREDGTKYKGENFAYSQMNRVDGTWLYYNQYFQDHPEMILGTMKNTGTMYQRDSLNVEPKGKDLGKQITDAIGKITARMDYSAVQPSVEQLQERAAKARQNTKENGYEVKDGKIYQNKNGELAEVTMKEADIQKVKDMLGIRDTARALQELQKQGADKKAIADKRAELNKLYDAFVQKNGMLHNPKNARLIEADPDHFFILALENYDKKKKTAEKADIFIRDTIAPVVTVAHADSAQDAVAVVLNEKGYIDLKRAAELLSVSEDEARAAMVDTGLAFLTEDGTLETRENYLSGDVRAKLRKAEALATVDSRYQRNVDELKKVIPEDVTRESIYVKPGATWIPDAVYEQFICETLKEWNGYRRNVTVKYIPQSGEYTIELSNSAKNDFRNTQEWGTKDRTFAELLDALMNNRTISVYRRTMDGHSYLDEAATLAAREKAEKIQKRFTEWLWENEDRAKQLEKLYNDQYNAIVVPDYDGSGLTIAGANADKTLRPHQKNVVHRIIQSGGNTLIAHCVGAGKTAEMAGAAMKLRQLGIVQKPVFVVPKALVGQWGNEFLDFFPAAKILVLSENDFNAKNRKEFANRIATGDYDAIIMSREQFGKIPMTPEYEKAFYQDTIDQITAAMQEEKQNSGKKGASVKELEKAKKRLEAKLKALEIKKKDEAAINFEDMGIDSIFVDEAHEYKNLFFTSNMNNISGLGNKEGSQRAFDMYMKTRYLRSVNGGRGIVFATATPVMNSMSEMYIMQKYLQEDKLNQIGIRSFDAWANLFGEVMTVIEPTPSGKGFRQKEAFARFKNLPELQRLFRSFADVKTKIEGLKIPKMKGGKRITVECEPGAFQLQYIDQLAERAEKMRHGKVDPKEDNMLKITSEGRKLSYTQRMIDPSLPYEEGCKLIKCVDNVEQIWRESKANKGTQLIFCDMATPKGSANIETESAQDMTEDADSVDFYGDIKRMLIARGVPANEIAFIHDADTNEKRTKLFEDVNEGNVRVLIGSTGKMGVGMNAQKRMVALHHLDAPWRPGDIEQREGRVLRQGNMNDEVGIYVYVTKRTFDTRMWDNLYRKASFINQIMNGTNTAREVEGDGDFALSAAEIKAIATGDPLIVEQFEVANKIKQLESLEREHNKEKKRARETIAQNGVMIESYERQLPKVEADQKTAAAALDGDFVMKVDGKRYTERAKAAGPLLEAVKKHEGIVSDKKIGDFGGFTLYADGKGSIVIKGEGVYSVNVNFDSADGTMSRVINQIKNLQDNANAMRKRIAELKEENRSAEKRMNEPFEKADELEQLRARNEEIADILNPVEDQAGADNVSEEDEGEEKLGIKHSMRGKDGKELTITEDEMEENKKIIASLPAIIIENEPDYHRFLNGNFIEEGIKYFAEIGGKAENKIIGTVDLVKSGLEHIVSQKSVSELKAKTLCAIKPIIENGKIVEIDNGHKGKKYDTAVIAGDIKLKDGEYLVGVVVAQHNGGTRGQKNNYSFHSVFAIKEGADRSSIDASSALVTPGSAPTTLSILRQIAKYKWEFKNGAKTDKNDSRALKSTRDPEDLSNRQLLARAYEGILADEKDRKYLEKYKEIIAQLDADAEEVRKLKREYHDKTFVKGQVDKEGAAKARAQYLALEKKIAQADETLLKLERSEPLKKALEFEQKEAKRKAEERANSTIKNYHEGVSRREYAVRIKKTAERLGQWLNQPDNTKHVPKAAQQAVADFILTITQSRMAEFTGKGGVRRERNFIESMRRLKDFVSNVNAYKMSSAEERVHEDYKEFIDLPRGFEDQLAALITNLEKTISEAGRVHVVDEMNSEQMKELYKVLTTISTSITKINDFLTESAFKHVDTAAQNTMNFIRDQGKVEYWKNGGVHNYMNWENTQPIRAMERFGEGGKAVWNGLKKGQAQLAFNLSEAIRLAEGRFTNEEISAWGLKGLKSDMFTPEEIKKWSETIREFSLGGRMVPMTAAHAIDVYNLLKRGQAVGHIFGEGGRVTDFRDKKGKLIRDKGGAITREEAAAIAAYVESDPRMKQVADNMQRIVSNFGKKMGNPVNMKRFGYEFMNEDNYWPIESDRDYLQAKTDSSKGNELYRLLNISSVKPLTEGARNRIMIRNAFDVFAQNLIDMAQYNALALPVLDAVKWINYRESWEETTEDGRRRKVYGEGVRSTARDMYGNAAARYVIELLKDIQGTQATGDWGENFSRKMLTRYNRAAIAANFSVAAKQPMSITRATMELGGFDLITGAVKNIGQYKHNLETMLKYSGIAVWKINMGFYDVNVSRSAKRLILRDDTKLDKLLNATTALNEKMDTVTWAAIWGACENWVRKQGGTYATTDAFYQAVADKFEDVIYKTQVVDSILTRSQFMRGTSFMNKWFSSFMSEPTTSYNMVLDAWWKFRNDMRRGLNFGQAFAENHRQILRTTAVYMVSAAVMTLLEALIGAWRDDDDYETFLEKYNAGLLNNAIDEFNVLNNLPIVRDVMDYIKQVMAEYVLPDEWNVYANAGGSPVFSGLDTFMGAADVWDKVITGKSNYTLYGAIYKTANAFSQISGLPVAPAMREVVAMWNNLVEFDVLAPEMRIETYESSVKNGATALYKAIISGDKDREKKVRGQLAANGVDDKKLDEAMRALIKADTLAGKITEETAQKYLREMTGLGKNDAYYKVQEWAYEDTHEDQYSRFDKLEEAIVSGKGSIKEAMNELTAHGYSQKEVQSKVRSIISNQTGKLKKMTPTKAESLLMQYGGMNANEAWIRSQELKYQQLTGTETTADAAMVIYAIDRQQNPKDAIDGLLAHGKEKKDIASSITSKYKQQYLDLRKSNASAAAALKGRLISVFDYL